MGIIIRVNLCYPWDMILTQISQIYADFFALMKKTIKTPFDVSPLEAAAHLPYLYALSVPVSFRYTPTYSTLGTYRYQDIKRKNRKNTWL